MTSCKNCKRDIPKGQKKCYQCGASQSFIRNHLKTGFSFLLALGLLLVASNWYINNAIKAAERNSAQQAESNSEAISLQKQQVELELRKNLEKLSQAEAKVLKANEDNASLALELAASQTKLLEAENKIAEVEKRSSWLLKLNRQLKAQVASLSEKQSTPASDILGKNEDVAEPEEAPAEPIIDET